MEETVLEKIAIEFLEFLFGVGETLISTFVWWWIVYIFFRYFLKEIVFKDDTSGWKRLSESFRRGIEELIDAFSSAMSAVSLIAKQWMEEKKEEVK